MSYLLVVVQVPAVLGVPQVDAVQLCERPPDIRVFCTAAIRVGDPLSCPSVDLASRDWLRLGAPGVLPRFGRDSAAGEDSRTSSNLVT